jgi:ankyrin repeat protein
MTARLALLLGLVVMAEMVGTHDAGAQIGLFGSYWENVARASRQNDSDQVRALMADNGNPNQTDEELRTGLHYGAINGNLTIIAILVKAKARLDSKDKMGNTPLHLAAERNQSEALKLLLDVGASIDSENKSGMTPLMIAANRGYLEIVQVLLDKGASVTKTDFTGRNAAGWAAESRRPAVVQAIKRAQNARRS